MTVQRRASRRGFRVRRQRNTSRRSGWMAACRPRFPKATRLPPTGGCQGPRSPSWAAGRSGSTSTCRSVRYGAGIATSTPTPPRSSATSAASRARRSPRPHRRGAAAATDAGDRERARWTRCSSEGVRRRCLTRATSGRCCVDLRGVRARPRRRDDDGSQPRLRRRLGSGGPREAGFTRVSFGMQTAVGRCSPSGPHPHPGACPAVVDRSREAGFDHVSLDLIYGTPGESLADWELSVEAALAVDRPCLGVLADRRARHPAGARVRRGDPSDAGRGRSRPTCTPRRRAVQHGRLAVVRGVELGAPRAGLSAQRALLARRYWWGIGPGAHSHVVGCGGGTSSTPRRTSIG